MDISYGGIVILAIAIFIFWVIVYRRSLLIEKPSLDGNPLNGVGFAVGLTVWLAGVAAFAFSEVVQSNAQLMMAVVIVHHFLSPTCWTECHKGGTVGKMGLAM